MQHVLFLDKITELIEVTQVTCKKVSICERERTTTKSRKGDSSTTRKEKENGSTTHKEEETAPVQKRMGRRPPFGWCC